MGVAVGVGVAVDMGVVVDVGVTVDTGVAVGVGVTVVMGVATAVSTAASLLSILLSLASIAVNLSPGWDGVGVAVGTGVAPPQVGRFRLAASLSLTCSKLYGTHPLKLLPASRHLVKAVRLFSDAGIVPVRLLELRSSVLRAGRLPRPTGRMPSRFRLGSDNSVTRPPSTFMPSHFSIERPDHQFSFALPRRSDFMPSKASQSEISPALPAATAPPLTHAESVCPMTKPTVTVPTVTTMAIDTATTAMALIKFSLLRQTGFSATR